MGPWQDRSAPAADSEERPGRRQPERGPLVTGTVSHARGKREDALRLDRPVLRGTALNWHMQAMVLKDVVDSLLRTAGADDYFRDGFCGVEWHG